MYPGILPANDHLTIMFIKQEQLHLLHAVTKSTIANLRLKYRPMHSKKRWRIHNFVTCYKSKVATHSQVMYEPTQSRINSVRTIRKMGFEYAGSLCKCPHYYYYYYLLFSKFALVFSN